MTNTARISSLVSSLLLSSGLLLLTPLPSFGKEAKDAPKTSSIKIDHKIAASELPALAKISFDEALKTALASVPGKLLKAELEVEDGGLQYSAEIVTADKKITEVEIDAGNGKVLAIDTDEHND